MHRMVRQGRPCGMNPNPHGQIRASHGWFGRHTMGRRFVGSGRQRLRIPWGNARFDGLRRIRQARCRQERRLGCRGRNTGGAQLLLAREDCAMQGQSGCKAMAHWVACAKPAHRHHAFRTEPPHSGRRGSAAQPGFLCARAGLSSTRAVGYGCLSGTRQSVAVPVVRRTAKTGPQR